MNTLKNFVSKYKTALSVLIGLFVVMALYWVTRLKKEITATMLYIDTNPEAASWKALITSKASAAGNTYQQQLYIDARYTVKMTHKNNIFRFLV
jgi:menaquinone-dependent protoporphyrinogen IX oxidase